MSYNHLRTKLKPGNYLQTISRPMAGRFLLVGLLVMLAMVTLGEARRDNSKARGYVKTTFQREVKITDKDKNRLVNETINIIIETDEEIPTHYELPMDFFLESIVDSPSGLNATTHGSPKLVGGVRKNAIMVQGGGHSNILVSRGATMVHECFFDLTYCREGYTIGLWVNFPSLPNQEHVYISSGGDVISSHGIAMSLNHNGELTFTFKTKEGSLRKFTSQSNAVVPNRWIHILATWSQNKGVQLYMNGFRVRGQPSGDHSSAIGSREPRQFWFGRSLESSRYHRDQPFVFDDVHFWMFEFDDKMAREIGHVDVYRLPIHDIRRMTGDRTSPKFIQSGKSEDALEFDGQTTFFSDDMKHHCHTNVTSCFNGFLLSGWIKFGPFKNGGHYVSTGDYGLKLYYKDKALVGEALFDDHFWNVTWRRGVEGQWYFVELSMSPDENIVLYIDQYPVSTARSPRDRTPPNDFADSNIEFGRRSHNLGHAGFTLDDFELWSADRNMLEVLGYIVRGRPIRYHVPMDYVVDDRIPHQNLSITVANRPIVVKGKVRDAIDLSGKGQYITVDTRQGHVQPCLYNLNFCKAGATISTWIKPGELPDGMEYFSTGTYGFKMWQDAGRTEASARTSDREWTLVTRGQLSLTRDKWQLVELTFDPHSRGGKLKMYIDGKLEAESEEEGRPKEREESSGEVFIGRGDGTRQNTKYGIFTIDEFEYWFANRDYLTKFNFIKRGQFSDHIHLTMDDIKDNKVIHNFLDVSTYGAPQLVGGRVGNAVNFNGIGQYLDLGGHRDNCFGDLALCQDGMTGSMWIRFNSFPDHGYLFSNGGGLQVYTAEGNKLFVVIDIGGKKWTVVVPGLKVGKWYFAEYTWHPGSGLKVFINNRPVGFCSAYQPSTKGFTSRSGRVLIGAANPGEPDNGRVAHNADAVIDEFEYWFLDRDSLIGSKSIVRDAITYIHFPFEIQDGSRVYHPDFNVYLHNGASLTEGRVGNGLALVPRSYASFKDQSRICMGNIALCPNGLTISMLIRPSGEIGKILTSGSYSVSLIGDELRVQFLNGTNIWNVNTRNALTPNTWQQLDLTWHPEKGVEVWVDDRKVASKETPEYVRYPEPQNNELYLGWPSEVTGRQTGNVTVDELQFWYASRDQLDLDPLINRIILDMDVISNNRLVNPYQVIKVINNAINVPAINLTGVELDGNGQYLESSDSMLVCRGNLEDCQQGFTLRFKLKPNQILDNQYLLSSAPIDVYLRNRRLISELRTSYKIWKVTSDELSPDTWYQVDLSWSPVEGASLHINGEKVSSTVGEANPGGQHTLNTWKKFFIGRANTNMFNEKYASAVFDDVQFWEARRDLLIRKGLITSERTGTTHHWGVITPSPTFVFPSIYPGSNRRLIFDGRTWYLYDLSHLPTEFLRQNKEEKLKIHFLTTHPDGLLWFNGDPNNNVHMLLKDGQLYFVVTRDGKVSRTPIGRPPMNDNQWHEIFVSRNDKQVDVLVDGQDHTFTVDFPINFFRPGTTYVGGSGQTWNLTQHFINSNFDGKIREIWHHGESFPKDFDYKGLIFVKPHPSFMNSSGSWIDETDDYVGLQHPKPILINIVEGDEKVRPKQDMPITVDGNSFVSISGIRPSAPQEGGVSSYEMKFRTAHPNGILAFLRHQSHPFNSALIELYDGVPYLVADFGRGYQRLRFGNRPMRVDDNREHYIKMMSSGDWLKLTLDDETSTHQLVLGRNQSLDIFSQRAKILHLGGTQEDLPWHSWNRLSREFFKGCIWGVRFNSGETLDLVKALGSNKGGIQQQCIPSMEYCSQRPCRNGGVCSEVPNGYRCDCSNTQFTGRNCETNAQFAHFGDRDRLELTFTPTKVTHTNDISLRFRTPKENVHLFTASNYRNNDILKVTLDGGIGRVESRFGNARNSMFESFKCPQPLNDNQWHTVHIKRRANYLEAYVEDCEKVTFNYPGENYDFLIDRIILGRDEDRSFIGHFQNFFIDGVDVFPRILRGGDDINIITTVKTTDTEKVVPFNPITIRANSNAFLYLDPLQFLGDTNITFMFRTKDPDVILMYNSGHEDDFFAVELVGGRLHVVANDGTDVKEVTSSAGRLNDNNWHEITIEQKPNNKYDVIVDQRYRDSLQFAPSRHTLDMKDRLYIGNVPTEVKDRLPGAVRSRNGFSGCFASLVINRIFYQMDNDQYLTPFITAGCSNTTGYCVPGICSFGGVCHEKQDGFWCDCNMTSYDGVKCRDEAKGFIFSMRGGKGIAILRLEPPTSTTSDRIALMFMTHESNGTLLKADGRMGDFIELKLVNGHVVAVYKVGDKIHEIWERRNFNDGQAHRVVFVRDGEKALLRVDDYPENAISVGRSDVLFDEMSIIKLGGDLDRRNEIIHHFDGIIAGVNINGWRVVEHSETRTRGDVYDATRPFYVEKRYTVVTPKVTHPPILPPDIGPPVEIHPTGSTGGGGMSWGNEGVIVPDGGAVFEPIIGEAVVPGIGGGARAAGVAGAMIGALLLASSAMWALYKFKPGLLGGPKGSVPSQFTPLLGANGESSVVHADLRDHFPAVSARTTGGAAGVDGVDGGVVFSSGGGTIQGYHISGSANAPAGLQTTRSSEFRHDSTMQGFQEPLPLNQSVTYSYERSQVLTQQGAVPSLPSSPGQFGTNQFGTGQFSMRNVDLSYGGFNQQEIFTQQQQQRMIQQQQQLMGSTLGHSSTLGQGQRSFMTAEEIRVDCVQMTNNGRFVVTGSNCGPPQVWDLKSGELVKVMRGEELSSTDLHLANGDTLLVGQVAELEPIDLNETSSSNKVHHRRLQIWDFETGKPLDMSRTETCTASCMMGDGEKIVLGRTEKFGGGTTIIIWDILNNEPIRHIKCDASVGFADHISYLNASKDNRYIVAGFQNSYDNTANYVTFDLASMDAGGMRVASLDAAVDVTTLLNDKEAVTGTRRGEMVVWSLKTGRQVRSIGGPGMLAHQGEIKEVVVSRDGQLLVSASVDGTLKVWDVETENLLHTLIGHRDEVWCATVSPDNELVGSGSRDGTIRLWKVSDGTSVAAIDAGMTIFKVLLSNNKKTVVALGDKGGARKLIMLRVVRSTATIDRRTFNP